MKIVSVNSVLTYFDEIVPPKIIAVMSMQRSGSTTVSRLLASHKCAVWGNEVFVPREDGEVTQDELGIHELTGRNVTYSRSRPVDFLLEANKIICKSDMVPEECNGMCTIVVKVFETHHVSRFGTLNIQDMLRSPDVGIVVLQREMKDWFNSYHAATKEGDWVTVPDKERPKRVKVNSVPDFHVNRYKKWFETIREEIINFGKIHVEIPFSAVKTCRLFDSVLPSIYTVFGFDIHKGVDIKNMWNTDNMESLLESCKDYLM